MPIPYLDIEVFEEMSLLEKKWPDFQALFTNKRNMPYELFDSEGIITLKPNVESASISPSARYF
jgi:hypothetical protein